jgi:hypothetical protein
LKLRTKHITSIKQALSRGRGVDEGKLDKHNFLISLSQIEHLIHIKSNAFNHGKNKYLCWYLDQVTTAETRPETIMTDAAAT